MDVTLGLNLTASSNQTLSGGAMHTPRHILAPLASYCVAH